MARRVGVRRHLRRRRQLQERIQTQRRKHEPNVPGGLRPLKPFRPARLAPRRPARPRRARYVGVAMSRNRMRRALQATRLEDFDILMERPPKRFSPGPEPELTRAVPGRALGINPPGINRKEVFVLVKESPRGTSAWGSESRREKIVGKALFKPASGEEGWPERDYGIPTGKQYIREAVAYTLDELLGFDVVPPTEIRLANFKGAEEVGSLQQWMERSRGRGRNAAKADSDDWMEVAIIDILMMNRDRHANNVLYVGNDIYAIDNGLSAGSLPGLRNEAWRFLEGQRIPHHLRDAMNSVEEGDIRAAFAPIENRRRVDEAVARWEWLRARDTIPTKREFEQFMFQWMLDNLPSDELERARKQMALAYNDHDGYRDIIRAFGDRAMPRGYVYDPVNYRVRQAE